MTRMPYLRGAQRAALSLAIAGAALTGFIAPATVLANTQTDIARQIHGGGAALSQLKYDLTITSFDGTPIAVTVYQPRLDQGQPAPLLLYSHGWGGSRSTDLGESDALTATARKAWESGYFVMTFDQRGFGDSGGQANVQDPEIEGRDIQTLLDWAEGTLSPHLAYLRGSPLVGGLGVSYGGGFQLIGASIDPRFDALVPVITWNDLSYSLSPDLVPKTLWLSVLTGAAAADQAPWVTQGYLESLGGTTSESTSSRLAGHGLGAFCQPRTDGQGVPNVDAFFIQGVNDTLFNTNEAARNFDCLRQAGNDAYLLVTTGGHVLPGFQDGSGGGLAGLGGLYNNVQCGNTRYSVADMTYRFLDGKLRRLQRDIPIPRVCIAQGSTQGAVSTEMYRGGMQTHVDSGNLLIGPPSLDVVLNLLRKLDPATLAEVLSRLSADTVSLLTGALVGLVSADADRVTALLQEMVDTLPPALIAELGTAPRFVPLHRANGRQILAGIPTADLMIDGEALLDPRVFVGLGVRRFGRLSPELLHDQVLPMRGTGQRATELVGVSTQLHFGDEVGLMLYGFHPQYTLGFSRLPSAVRVQGKVDLPLR
jgi:ABC-2 type transport system ATP-binding protein